MRIFLRSTMTAGSHFEIRPDEAHPNGAEPTNVSMYVCYNMRERIKHVAVVGSQLGFDDWAALAHFDYQGWLPEAEKMEITSFGWTGDTDEERFGSQDVLFTKRVFFFIDRISRDEKARLINSLKQRDYQAIVVDDEKWERRLAERRNQKPDVFVSYDFRDQDAFVEKLAHQMVLLDLNVWYAGFSIKPGTRLAEAIDRGLTQSRYGVLVVSPNMLQNSGWASMEMSSLLNRAARDQNLIPVWLGVDAAMVKARSALLADIAAIDAKGGVEKVAATVFSVVGGPATEGEAARHPHEPADARYLPPPGRSGKDACASLAPRAATCWSRLHVALALVLVPRSGGRCRSARID